MPPDVVEELSKPTGATVRGSLSRFQRSRPSDRLPPAIPRPIPRAGSIWRLLQLQERHPDCVIFSSGYVYALWIPLTGCPCVS